MPIKIVLLLAGIFLSSVLFAQLPSLPSNLSNVRSVDVSDEQVSQITVYMRNNNLTSQQAYELVTRRGMNQSEAATLRDRIEKSISNSGGIDNNPNTDASAYGDRKPGNINADKSFPDSANKTIQVLNPKKIFGLEIFNNGVLTFEPNLKIATPINYIIGPDDEINVNIYGYQEAKYTVKVGPEGDITIPYIGVLYVSGLTIEQATAKIKSKLSTAGYSNIKTGLTKVNVTLGRIRNIKVTILGEVRKPGTYSLPSLATAFNALYVSGGPNDIGSMRNIQIIRNGKVIDRLDIYDFLVKGEQKSNIGLRDQDVIRIPSYDVRVSLDGQVKRTGLYEILPTETLKDLFEFAGGFSDSAYTASITAYRTTDIDKRIIDIDKKDFSAYKPIRTESFVVKKIIGRYVNRVSISGSVYLPGDYQFKAGMTLKDLILKAQGLKEDAYNPRGLIVRSKPDLTLEYVSFSPLEAMNDGSGNMLLQPNDKVSVASVSDIKENSTVTIYGEVRFPGTYGYVSNMTIKDLLLLAGGFTDAALPQRIELARRIKTDTFDINSTEVSQVFDIASAKNLGSSVADMPLTPFDAILVRKNPGYQPQVNVLVSGEVTFPGPYVLKTKNERVSDIIKRAGGLTPQAYNQGGYLTRNNGKSILNQLNTQKVNKIQETLKDTTKGVRLEVERTVDQIAIDLSTILKNPGGRNDLILEEGDVITIPKEKMDVRISGQVLFPTRVVYDENLNLKDYLGRAGGTANNARKGKVYVLYANGNAARTKHFLFFRSYPVVTAGSEVIVPKKNEVERRRMSTGEVIGIATAVTSFAGVLLSLLINARK